MTEISTNLGLPYLAAAQAQKHITLNEALERLDAVVQLHLKGVDQVAPPASPQEGDVWGVGAAPTGGWAGNAGQLAVFSNGGWFFVAPKAGWRASLGGAIVIWSGTGWEAPDLPSLENLAGIGIGAGYDGTNKLVVAGDATLLTHGAAGGHQLKLNKSTVGDTASLLFQSGWSGRAEMGVAGEDAFSVKVSADGSTWKTGLRIDGTNGAAELPSGARAMFGTASLPSFTFAGDADTGLYRSSANSLGFATGGVRRATLTASAFEVDVPLQGSAVVQDASDGGAGKVVTVGYGGLGGLAPAITGTGALDGLLVNARRGIAAADVVAVGGPAGAGAGVCDTYALDASSISQTFHEVTAPFRLWSRGWDGLSWSAWMRGGNRIVGDITGTGEAQEGGILERGSAAGGEYIRYADGTQICWHVSPSLTVDTAVGSGGQFYSAAGYVWTFPKAFVAAPVVSTTAQAITGAPSHAAALTSDAVTGAGCGVTLLAHGSGSTGRVQLMATGRWF